MTTPADHALDAAEESLRDAIRSLAQVYAGTLAGHEKYKAAAGTVAITLTDAWETLAAVRPKAVTDEDDGHQD